MRKVMIYKRYERFWHWSQMGLVALLMLTGFEIHGSYSLLGYCGAVQVHNLAAAALIILITFTIFWHFTTGEWKQYIPTTDKLVAQIKYYTRGIFSGAPHPSKKTELSKLNPIQRLTYLGLKIVIFQVQIISGILYMLYPSVKVFSIETVAITHTASTFLLLMFIIVHVYMTTTGHTIFSNLRAMITGYEELEPE